jgi:hypothetical protein
MNRVFTCFFLFLFFCGVCYAGDYEMAVVTSDEPSKSNAVSTALKGSIAAVRPSGFAWSSTQLHEYLILKISCDAKQAQDFTDPYYLDDPGQSHFPGLLTKEQIWASRKTLIDFSLLKNTLYKDLDIDLLSDKAVTYQPF